MAEHGPTYPTLSPDGSHTRVDLGAGHYIRVAYNPPEDGFPRGTISIRSYNPNTKKLAMGPKLKVEAVTELIGALALIVSANDSTAAGDKGTK